ncbi:hypothetical protein PybrP1_011865 [[Pythium] brassicae (nom. inval.)]|nr:hypothetical protein PybrP1_011865 [[Pythium] brassicae (nom. inval.)]
MCILLLYRAEHPSSRLRAPYGDRTSFTQSRDSFTHSPLIFHVDARGRVLAQRARRTVAELLRLAPALGHTLRPRTHSHLLLGRLDVDVAELGLVAEVLVDRDDARRRVHGVDVRDGDLALDVAARAARAVELAEVLRVEAVDADGARAVVLHDLVLGVARATADDLGHTRGRTALDAQRVLAHVLPPHILDRAVVLVAVHALHLVLADDHVLERGPRLNEEHHRVLAALLLALALDVRELVRLHATIERRAGLDHVRRREGDGALAGGPRALGHGGGVSARHEREGGSDDSGNGGERLDHGSGDSEERRKGRRVLARKLRNEQRTPAISLSLSLSLSVSLSRLIDHNRPVRDALILTVLH